MVLSVPWGESNFNKCISPPDKTNLNNNKKKNLELNALQQSKPLVIKSAITKP